MDMELAGPWSSVDIAVRVSIPWENSRAVMAETTGAMTRATPATRERKETMVACVVGDGEVCVWSCEDEGDVGDDDEEYDRDRGPAISCPFLHQE